MKNITTNIKNRTFSIICDECQNIIIVPFNELYKTKSFICSCGKSYDVKDEFIDELKSHIAAFSSNKRSKFA